MTTVFVVKWLFLLSILYQDTCIIALDNGLARTPPMGWLVWERFRCNVDCVNDPNYCIHENLFKQMAGIVASQGYKEAGYVYINVDECWTATTRDADGRLQPDYKRFPNGMAALGDYIHNKGLKYGLYTDYGTRTCNGEYPGSKDFLQLDSETFAAWGADYVKLDGCYDDPYAWTKYGYPDMAFWLNRTGRPIVLGTEFPFYQIRPGYQPDYKALSKVCNLARNHPDVQDSWDSIVDIILFYANGTDFAAAAGPGFWNDPDMLIIGNFGLSYDQQKVQMAMWCLWASPLFMSVDLRDIRNESKYLLLNTSAIAINQDPLGVQGSLLAYIGKHIQVWTKQLAPISHGGPSPYAFTVLNLGTDGTPQVVKLTLEFLKLTNLNGYAIHEVFDGYVVGRFALNSTFIVKVNPTGIFFGKATPL